METGEDRWIYYLASCLIDRVMSFAYATQLEAFGLFSSSPPCYGPGTISCSFLAHCLAHTDPSFFAITLHPTLGHLVHYDPVSCAHSLTWRLSSRSCLQMGCSPAGYQVYLLAFPCQMSLIQLALHWSSRFSQSQGQLILWVVAASRSPSYFS